MCIRDRNIAEGPHITGEDLRPYLDAEHAVQEGVVPEIQLLEEMEKQEIARALKYFGTTLDGKKRAARALGVSLATLYNKLKRYQMQAGSNL